MLTFPTNVRKNSAAAPPDEGFIPYFSQSPQFWTVTKRQLLPK
jgi:hypothetical protein